MASSLLSALITKLNRSSKTLTLTPNPSPFPNPKPLHLLASQFSTSFLITKTPKKFRKKRKKKDSPRTKPVQSEPNLLPHLERLVHRSSSLHFLTKTRHHLSSAAVPDRSLLLSAAANLHRQLGLPRGRNPARSIERHPLLLRFFPGADGKVWFGFTHLMEELLEEERRIEDLMEADRVHTVRKLLMMAAGNRIPVRKIQHCRSLFGIPADFPDRVQKYPNWFRIVGDAIELVNWDPLLAVSALEREFIVDEDRVRKAFKFGVRHGKDLDLDYEDTRKLNMLSTLPLVSPYADGSKLDVWTLEAEKYRVGVVHEFLSLTLEKMASIHHIVEFREEFSLTRQTYQMLLKQPRTFYLAGTEMNWVVFLRDGYDESGNLIKKDPQVIFNEKLYKYAEMDETESCYQEQLI